MSEEHQYWVVTSSEEAHGPYGSFESAYFFGAMNLEPGTWTITMT